MTAFEHESFARDGHADALRRLLGRHGPLVQGAMALAGVAGGAEPVAARLQRRVSAFTARRFKGPEDAWLPSFLQAMLSPAAGPGERPPLSTEAEATTRIGRQALYLAAHADLGADQLAIVFRRAPAAVVEAMVDTLLADAGPEVAGGAAGPFHLPARTLAALTAGVLADAALTRATAHVAYCESCRARAASLGAGLAGALGEAPPALDPATIEATVASALAARLEQQAWPRTLRFAGLRPGARFRPFRLGVVGVLGVLMLTAALLQIHHAVVAGRRIDSALTVQSTDRLLAGASTALSVRVADLTGKKPALAAGVDVTARLLGVAGRELGTARGKTDAQGMAALTLTVSPLVSSRESGVLVAEAEVDGERRRAERSVEVVREVRQHLSSDKPTYQPGQTVHLRGLSIDAGSGKPLGGRPAHLIVRDPRGNRISDVPTGVSPMGVTSADVELSPGAVLGHYTATLLVDDETATAEFKVERYQLPPFSVAVSSPIGSTDGKQPFAVDVAATFTNGVPVARGMARLAAIADGDVFFDEPVAIKDGKASFKVRVPDYLADARWRPPTTIVLRATVRDPAGRAESGTGAVTLTGDAMAVTVVSEAPSVRRNLPRANHILVRAVRPDLRPVQTKVELFAPGDDELSTVGSGERLGEALTGADGLAVLDLPPAFFGRPLAVLAKDPEDGKQYWTSLPAPPTREGALVLACDRALLRAGETLDCEVFVPSPKARAVRVERAGQVVALGTTPDVQGLAHVKLPLPATATGLLRVTMDDAPTEDAVHVLAAPHDGLRVEMSGLEPRRPGDEVGLKLRVTNGEGKPRPASVGLAVVDAAVFARVAGTTPQQIVRALFARPDIAPEGMALLFPEQVASEAGGQTWTPGQQAQARWLLSTAATGAAAVRADSSESPDRMRLASDANDARRRAQNATGVTVIALAVALLMTLLAVSFWFRHGFGALCAALLIGVLLRVLLTQFLDMRDQTVDPVALLIALGVFASLMFSAARVRTATLSGRATGPSVERKALKVVLVGGPIALLAATFLLTMSRSYSPIGGVRYEMAKSTSADTWAAPPSPSPQAPASAAPGGSLDDLVGALDGARRDRAEESPRPVAAMAPPERSEAKKSDEGRMGGFSSMNEKEASTGGRARAPASNAPRGPGGGGDQAEVRTRQDFPETLYFNPNAVVGENGEGEVRFRVADSITTWEAHALASDTEGLLGAGHGKLVVTQPFHVDVDVPMDLTAGDDVTLQVAAQNETDQPGLARLEATADPGLRLDTTPLAEPIALAARGLAGRLVPLKALGSGPLAVTVQGALGALTDALKRTIRVTPNGREVKTTAAGLVVDSVRRKIDLPADAFAEGKSVVLTLLGSPLAAALDGLDLLAAEPHGSFEQQASTIYSNVLILQALRETGRLLPEQEAAILRLLRLSYQDVLGYEIAGGGFSAFGRGIDLVHTAWGLFVLTQIAPHTYIDPDVLTRLNNVLAGQQASDGAFRGPTETAYVALAMLASDKDCLATEDPVVTDPAKKWTPAQRVSRAACKRVVQRLEDAFAIVEGVDSYTLAWAADALLTAGGSHRARAESILDELDRRAAIVGEGRLRRVTFKPRMATLYGARGPSAELETTAVVAHALAIHGGRGDKAREALRALLALRSPNGGFYSSQGTALALRAMLAAAKAGQAGGRARVVLDGTEVALVEFDPTTINAPRKIDLTDKVRPGAELTVSLDGWDGATDMGYRLTTHHFEPWTRPPAPPVLLEGQSPEEMAGLYMRQSLDAKKYGLGDRAMLTIDIDRVGGRVQHGLLVAQVGLPPGFRLADEALDDGVIGRTLRIEPAARGLTVYLDDPMYGRTGLSIPLVAARAVRSVVVPRSRVYFAYQPQIEGQATPVPVYVQAILGKRTGG